MHTEPLCPYCEGEDFAIKKISFPQSQEIATLIFCTSCGKIIGHPFNVEKDWSNFGEEG
jgi:hypothetical protein